MARYSKERKDELKKIKKNGLLFLKELKKLIKKEMYQLESVDRKNYFRDTINNGMVLEEPDGTFSITFNFKRLK